MLDLIKYIVDHFAEDPANVDYNVVEKGNAVDVTILLSESDMGKVIGKQGRIAQAIRCVVKAASVKENKKYIVDIV